MKRNRISEVCLDAATSSSTSNFTVPWALNLKALVLCFLLAFLPSLHANAQAEKSKCPVSNFPVNTQSKSQSPKVPAGIVKLEAELDRRALIMAEARKLKAEKPVPGAINDHRIVVRTDEDVVEAGKAIDALSPKLRFAYWYIQYSVDCFYAYFKRPPKDLDEFLSKNYLPISLTDSEKQILFDTLVLTCWNLNDKSIALNEIRFDKLVTKKGYNYEELEDRLPVIMFNHIFNEVMNSYISEAQVSFEPNIKAMYNYIDTQMGANDSFWQYALNDRKEFKGKAFFINYRAKEEVPDNIKMNRADFIIEYSLYEESDCGCGETKPDLIGKVRYLKLAWLY